MNNLWIIESTENGQQLFAHSDLERVKFLQLLVSKHFTTKLTQSTELPIIADSDLHKKFVFLNKLLTAEDVAINSIHTTRDSTGLVRILESTKKFYNIVYPENDAINRSIDAEIAELDGFKKYCTEHKHFLINRLYQVNYLQDILLVKLEIKKLIMVPPVDPYYVYEILNPALAIVINE